MGKLKDYMVDGHFERGPKKTTSLHSLIFGEDKWKNKVTKIDYVEI